MTSKANTHRRGLVLGQLLLPVVICITSFVIILVPNSGKFLIGRPMKVNSYSLTLIALYLDFARLIYFSFALRSMFDLIIGMIFFSAEQSDFPNSLLFNDRDHDRSSRSWISEFEYLQRLFRWIGRNAANHKRYKMGNKCICMRSVQMSSVEGVGFETKKNLVLI